MDGRFERYTILGHIGTGGMGEVFKARADGPHGFEKIVALKRVRPRWARDRVMAERLIQEARITAGLQHANIVSVFDFGRLGDELFIVMECVEGASLATILDTLRADGEWVTLAQTLQVVIEVARALEYAHRFSQGAAEGLVHRDVTPSNILVSTDGLVKLTDFGIAAWSELDGSGDVAGKPRYMAPEQLRGEPLDGRADLFALGVVFYSMLTRRHPWPRGTPDSPCPPPSTYDPSLLPEIEQLVVNLLELDRDRRPASADLLLRELLELSYATHIVLDPLVLRPLVQSVTPSSSECTTAPLKVPEVIVATAMPGEGATVLGIEGAAAAGREQELETPFFGIEQRRTAAPARARRGRSWATAAVVAIGAAALAIGLTIALLVGRDQRRPNAAVVARAVRSPDSAAPVGRPADAAPSRRRDVAVVDSRIARAAVAKKRRLAPRRQHPRGKTRVRHHRAARTREPAPTGELSIYVDPWAEVWVDGTKLSRTAPLRGLRLPAGRHRLRLVNPVLKREVTRNIRITAGGSTRVNVSLR